MSPNDKASGMKSAYERALEKMEAMGVERPRQEAFSNETLEAIAEARRVTEAKLAELEILHRDRLKRLDDPTPRGEQEDNYRRDKERIVADGEAKVAKLRGDR